MDFTSLNTKASAGQAAFLHLRHPALGHRMYHGEGSDPTTGKMTDKTKSPEKVGVFILGVESEVIRDQAREAANRELEQVEAEEEAMGLLAALITKFQHVYRGDDLLMPNLEDCTWFFELSDSFVEQVTKFSRDRSNFYKRD